MAVDLVFKRDYRLDRFGGVRELTGIENVSSAIQNRISTQPQSIPFRADYGVFLKRYLNQPLTPETTAQITQEVRTQILRDPRVSAINRIDVRSNQNEGLIVVRIEFILVGSNQVLNVELST